MTESVSGEPVSAATGNAGSGSLRESTRSIRAQGFSRATARALDVVQRLCPTYGITGAVVGIASESEVWTEPWGTVLTPARPERTRSDHRFLLTSVCKVVSAVQALTLVDHGLVDLDEPVRTLVPAFGCLGKEEVTIRHILSHTSGVPGASANTAEQLHPGFAARDHLRYALAAKASWAPGTRVEYSSSPFWALAAMCSAGHKQPYAQHLKTWFHNTGCEISFEPQHVAPDRYVRPTDEAAAALAEQTRRIAYPAGGMIAAVPDLLCFGRAFLDGAAADRFLSRELRDLMGKPATVGLPGQREPGHAGTTSERGLGWAIGGPGERRSQSILWHSGVSGTGLWVDRDQGLVLAFLSARWFLPRSFFASLVDDILSDSDPSLTR